MATICNICVMDNTARDIVYFQDEGCNYCKEAKKRLSEEFKPDARGLSALTNIVNEFKFIGRKHQYDCLIGLSGGADSSYLLHYMVTKFNVRPLVVHVDCGWNSEIAARNIESLTTKLGLDLYTEVLDWPTMRDLQLAVFRSGVANADIPQDHAITSLMVKIARKNKIKTLINGSNLATECILPHSWGHNALDCYQLKDIAKKFGNVNLEKFPILGYFEWKILTKYYHRMRIVKPLNYIVYNKKDAIGELVKTYNWASYGGKHHESVLTRFLQEVYFVERFGFVKARAHYSSMIISGQISRENALLELKKIKTEKSDRANMARFISQKLRISSENLEKIIFSPEVDYKKYKNQDNLDKFFRKIKNSGVGK